MLTNQEKCSTLHGQMYVFDDGYQEFLTGKSQTLRISIPRSKRDKMLRLIGEVPFHYLCLIRAYYSLAMAEQLDTYRDFRHKEYGSMAESLGSDVDDFFKSKVGVISHDEKELLIRYFCED